MSRPSLTASIGPSPVLGFMAAIEFPFRDVSLYYRASAALTKSAPVRTRSGAPSGRDSERTDAEDHGGVQSYPSTAQQIVIQPI